MITYRIKFSKSDDVKFVSHLDVMRIFQRAIKRAGLPIGYSKGFNPHQLMSFAQPLTLGTTSTGEYGDFEFEYELPASEIQERLNSAMPTGFGIENVVKLKEKTVNSMASVDGASYTVKFVKDITEDMLKDGLSGYINRDEILVVKKTKKSCKEANIREDILEIKDISENGEPEIFMLLNAGSRHNLKPDSVVESLCCYFGVAYNKFCAKYNRVNLFRRDENGKLVGLDVGVSADE